MKRCGEKTMSTQPRCARCGKTKGRKRVHFEVVGPWRKKPTSPPRWWVRLVAANGRIVLWSQGYSSQRGAIRAINIALSAEPYFVTRAVLQ